MFNSVLLYALGPTEIIVILVIVLLLFGGRKIPELMKGVAKGITEFKKGVNDDSQEKDKDDKKK
jgi:sec-independent protein translocase protein TatA